MARHEHAKSHRPTSVDAPVVPERQSPEAALIALQRLAGTAAVTVAIQRRTEPGEGQSQGGYLPIHDIRPAKPARTPPGVAQHLVTAAELADMPATGDAPALVAEYKKIHADRDARRAEAEKAAKEGKVVDPAAVSLCELGCRLSRYAS